MRNTAELRDGELDDEQAPAERDYDGPGWDWWTAGDAEDRAESLRLLRGFWDEYSPTARSIFQVMIDSPWPNTFLGEELVAAAGMTVPTGRNPRNVVAGYFAKPGRLRTADRLPICWCVGQPNDKGADEYWMTEDLAALWREAIKVPT